MTQSYKIKKNIVGFLSFLCTVGPLVTFIVMGLIQGEGKEKLCLSLTAIASIILAGLAVLRKIHLKSTIYIVLLGLYVALDNIVPFIVTLAICTILDEIFLTPLYKRLKEDYYTHKQIDKRLGDV